MKVIKWFLTIVTVISSVLLLNDVTIVQAMNDGYYPMGCNAFEVAKLRADGSFETVDCKNDLQAAKAVMYGLGDAGVIRHAASKSPTKIIYAANGMVFSYPQRRGNNTARLYQFLNRGGKQTYVTVHRPLSYEGTYTYNTSTGDGQILANINGFEGYMELSECDIIPMYAVTNGIPLWLGGEEAYKHEEPFKVIPVQPYFEVVQDGNYTDLVYRWSMGWAAARDTNVNANQYSHAVGPAASWMSVGARYYSKDGFTFYSDRECRHNKVGEYYNYYQFLPNRSKTKLPAWAFDNYLVAKNKNGKMNGMGQVFIDAQETYGVNALTVFALGCLESNYGQSNFARERNNLFGIAAYDSDPNRATWFDSIQDCVNYEMGGLLRGFMCSDDSRYFGQHLGNKGSGMNVKYAGDPFWGIKIASLAYDIDKFANGRNGQLTDFNQVAMGKVHDDRSTNILKSPGGEKLIHTHYSHDYQKNNILPLIGESGDYYQVQANDVLDASLNPMMNMRPGTVKEYDWNHNRGWIAKSSVVKLNAAPLVTVSNQPTGDFVKTFDAASFNSGTMHLEGKAYRPGIYVNDSNRISHTLELLDTSSYAVVKSFDARNEVSSNGEVKWSVDVPLSDIAKGTYIMRIACAYSSYSQYNDSYILPSGVSFTYAFVNGLDYSLQDVSDFAMFKVKDIQPGYGAHYDKDKNTVVCNDGFENWQYGKGCTLKPVEEKPMLIRSVTNTSMSDDYQTLTLDGMGCFLNKDAKADDGSVELIVEAEQLGSKNVIQIPTDTLNVETPMDLGDGYVYARIGYHAVVDVSALEEGNYKFNLVVKNGELVDKLPLCAIRDTFEIKPKVVDGLTIGLLANPISNYRLELMKEKNQIPFDSIKKPTRRMSFFMPENVTLHDSSLDLEAITFMYNKRTIKEDQPSYNVVLMDEDGNLHTLQAKANEASVDAKDIRSDVLYSVKHAKLEFLENNDLSGLEDGVYRMYVETTVGEHHDLYPMIWPRLLNVKSSTKDHRMYQIVQTSAYNQLTLLITTTNE